MRLANLLEPLNEWLSDNDFKSLSEVGDYWKELEIDFFLNEKDDVIELSKIIVPKSSRNTGIGTKAMNALLSYADKHGKKIILSPSNDFGGSKARLEKFYKSFGFVMNKGRNKDYRFRETMYRNPK